MEIRDLEVETLKETDVTKHGKDSKHTNVLTLVNNDRGIKVVLTREHGDFEGFHTGQSVDITIKNNQKTVKDFAKTNNQKAAEAKKTKPKAPKVEVKKSAPRKA